MANDAASSHRPSFPAGQVDFFLLPSFQAFSFSSSPWIVHFPSLLSYLFRTHFVPILCYKCLSINSWMLVLIGNDTKGIHLYGRGLDKTLSHSSFIHSLCKYLWNSSYMCGTRAMTGIKEVSSFMALWIFLRSLQNKWSNVSCEFCEGLWRKQEWRHRRQASEHQWPGRKAFSTEWAASSKVLR